ncbi:hypothetical protein [Halorubrum lipolyticum]|uniref:hypothetical protein n=1 Tax=Halorubrum lipolyticum TaxID=368624 RepID=UPI0011C7945D|nr:hypothetical protein [Halorubrum lipolyticum]
MNIGVLYIASGQQYIDEAISSASNLNTYDISSTLITPADEEFDARDELPFDNVIRKDGFRNDLGDKVKYISESPYEKTVFIDSDTAIVGDISPLFELLNRVDIAVARSPVDVVEFDDIPDSFPELNTGVVAYGNSKEVRNLFEKWEEIYNIYLKSGFPDDKDRNPKKRLLNQPSFRKALYESDISYSILPREYNFRGPGASASNKVKIIHHRRLISNSEFLNEINEVEVLRCIWRDKLYRRGHKDVVFGNNSLLVRSIYHLNQILPIEDWLQATGQFERAKYYYKKYVDRSDRSI